VAKEFIAEKTSAVVAIMQMTRCMNSSFVTFSRRPSEPDDGSNNRRAIAIGTRRAAGVGTIATPHRRIAAPLAMHLSAASAGNCGLHDLPGYPTCQQQKSEKYEETSHHAYRAAVLPVPHVTLAVRTADSNRQATGTGRPPDPWQPHSLAYGSGGERRTVTI
jgi:hypothetical protein